MTYFHACVGCAVNKATCQTRSDLKRQLHGLGVTSIKWKCKERKSRFTLGQAVWAQTVCNYGDGREDSVRDEWPGYIVKITGSSAKVFIKPGSPARDTDEGEAPFEPVSGGRGFCKIPLSRLTERNAHTATICPSCELPKSEGHAEGYSCSFWGGF